MSLAEPLNHRGGPRPPAFGQPLSAASAPSNTPAPASVYGSPGQHPPTGYEPPTMPVSPLDLSSRAGASVDDALLAPPAQLHRMARAWNATDEFLPARDVVALLHNQAWRAPAQVALTYSGADLYYGEFYGRVHQLARKLISLGFGAESCVAVVIRHSVDLAQAVCAALLAGAGIMPLDPDLRPAELAAVLAGATPDLIVTVSRDRITLPVGLPVLAVDEVPLNNMDPGPLAAADRRCRVRPAHPALFRRHPGGVSVVSHEALANELQWLAARFRIGQADTVLLQSPAAAASFCWELLLPLTTGSRLVIAEHAGLQSPLYLGGLMAAEQVTVTSTIPELPGAVPGESAMPAVRLVLVDTADRVVPDDYGYWYQLHRLTTSGLTALSWFIRQTAGEPPRLGAPIANTKAYVLDSRLRQVAVGIAGELYISGAALPRGVAGRPGETASTFLADPFHPGSRMLRTGQWARWRSDGTLESAGENSAPAVANLPVPTVQPAAKDPVPPPKSPAAQPPEQLLPPPTLPLMPGRKTLTAQPGTTVASDQSADTQQPPPDDGHHPEPVGDPQVRHWASRLADAPPPLGLPVDVAPGTRTGQRGEVYGELDPALHRALVEMARQQVVSPFMVVHAALAVLVSRLSRSAEVVLGINGATTNPLVIRTPVRAGASLVQVLAGVAAHDREAFPRADVPLDQLRAEVARLRSDNGVPQLFQVMLELSDSGGASPDSQEHHGADLVLGLTIHTGAEGGLGPVEMRAGYAADLFSADLVSRLVVDGYETVLRAFLADPSQRAGDIELLSVAERGRLLADCNTTATLVRPGVLAGWGSHWAATSPNGLAVVAGPQRLTWSVLSARANQLSNWLITQDIRPESIVGIIAGRPVDTVVTVHAVLAVGAACALLSSEQQPPAGTGLVLSARPAAHTPPHAVALETLRLHDFAVSGPVPLGQIYPSGPALVVSAGRDAAAVLTHAALMNQIRWVEAEFGLTPTDRLLPGQPITTLAGIRDVLLAAVSGAGLVLAEPSDDPDNLAALIRAHQVSCAELSASVLASFLDADADAVFSTIRELRCDVQQLDATLLASLRRQWTGTVRGGVSVAAAAGLVTSVVAASDLADGDVVPVPAGQPVWNTRVYVLDSRLRPVAVGMPGELYVAGAQLGRGFTGAAQTAAAFVADPFGVSGSRMIRAGVQVRWAMMANSGLPELVIADQWRAAYPQAPAPQPLATLPVSPLATAIQPAAHLAGPAERVHNVPVLIPVPGELDPGALQQALAEVAEQHEVLRTIYPAHQDTDYAEVVPMTVARPALQITQVPETEFAALLTDLAGAQFDITAEIPVRAGLAPAVTGQAVLALVVHPVVLNTPGELLTTETLTDDVLAAYVARTVEKPSPAADSVSMSPEAEPACRPADISTLGSVFAAAASRHAGAVAVSCDGREVTYAELDATSSRLARALIGRGAGAEDVVAIAAPRSEHSVIAAWAIAKTGAAIAELDPAQAARDAARLMAAGRVVAGVTTASLVAELPAEVDWIVLDDPGSPWLRRNSALEISPEELERPVLTRNLAWLSRTSGDTVLVAHTGLAETAVAQRSQYGVDGSARVLAHGGAGSGTTLAQLVLAAGAGATAVVSAASLSAAVLQAERITHVRNDIEIPAPELAELGITVVGASDTAPGVSVRQLGPDLRPAGSGGPQQRFLAGTVVPRGVWLGPGHTAGSVVADPAGPPGTRMVRADLTGR